MTRGRCWWIGQPQVEKPERGRQATLNPPSPPQGGARWRRGAGRLTNAQMSGSQSVAPRPGQPWHLASLKKRKVSNLTPRPAESNSGPSNGFCLFVCFWHMHNVIWRCYCGAGTEVDLLQTYLNSLSIKWLHPNYLYRTLVCSQKQTIAAGNVSHSMFGEKRVKPFLLLFSADKSFFS